MSCTELKNFVKVSYQSNNAQFARDLKSNWQFVLKEKSFNILGWLVEMSLRRGLKSKNMSDRMAHCEYIKHYSLAWFSTIEFDTHSSSSEWDGDMLLKYFAEAISTSWLPQWLKLGFTSLNIGPIGLKLFLDSVRRNGWENNINIFLNHNPIGSEWMNHIVETIQALWLRKGMYWNFSNCRIGNEWIISFARAIETQWFEENCTFDFSRNPISREWMMMFIWSIKKVWLKRSLRLHFFWLDNHWSSYQDDYESVPHRSLELLKVLEKTGLPDWVSIDLWANDIPAKQICELIEILTRISLEWDATIFLNSFDMGNDVWSYLLAIIEAGRWNPHLKLRLKNNQMETYMKESIKRAMIQQGLGYDEIYL